MPSRTFRAAPVRVRVPATSANLGPGFDAVGLALGLHDDVVVQVSDSGLRVDVAGEGAEDSPRDKRNLVVRALRAGFDHLGGQPRGLDVVCANRIPRRRGLGSSAAAIVAGLSAARALVLGGMSDDDLLSIATELEGHPDNVAACLLGGLTIAWRDGPAGVHAVRLEPHPDLLPVVFLPGTGYATAAARRVLPEAVPHADAAVTAGRAALLTEAVTRRPELLLAATHDLLHQPYRAAVMPRTAALVGALRERGVPAVVSGSGPGVLALTSSAEATRLLGDRAGRGWTATSLDVDRRGAQQLPLDAAGP